ncbi:MAG: polyamine aminopropyltransferase [Deltaproteobacteria bacterium]|nr:polyamine aminopropyltransferase [Deltaproteobacteria bacterium]
MRKFVESLYDSYGQMFRIDELLFESNTEHQHLIIFHNAQFGRVMVLDGIVQTTEKDEFIYHEMLTHVPMVAHGNAQRVLIVGGGDGAMLREVTQYDHVKKVTIVEIDQQVIDMCRKFFPNHSQGAFDDSRVSIVIDNGSHYVNQTREKFDIIISDSTDPIGPGEALFDLGFYTGCKRCLAPGGILVTQNGVAYMQLDVIKSTAGHLQTLFDDWHFYTAAVPTYVGGIMAFGWATDDKQLRQTDIETLRNRFAKAGVKTRYYNPDVHKGAFALPQYVLAAIDKPDNEYR